MPLQALIFDVDGTLAETEELHRQCFNDAFAEAGLNWVWTQALYRDLLGVTGGKERIRAFIDRFGGQPDQNAQAIAALHARKTRLYTARMAEGAIAPRPGIVRLIRAAHAACVRCAIATTTSRANIEALLAAAFPKGAEDWFTAIAAGDEVAAKKPAPDVYLRALELLGVPADNALAIEDSRLGLESARAAGIACIITRSPYTDGQNFAPALRVLDHLGDPDFLCTDIDGGMVTLAMLQDWHSKIRR